MDFYFGDGVHGRDGDRLGELRAVVYDPDTHQIVELAVQHAGFAGHVLLAPIGAVRAADHSGVDLELSLAQFDTLPTFADERNVAPPPDAENITDDEITEPIDVPDVPPVGAATGVESIAFTPIVQETLHVPPFDTVIDGDTRVWATDGEIGKVRAVQMNDQTDRIAGFLVHHGLIFGHDLQVPIESVTSIQPATITLHVERGQVPAARPEE